MYLCAKNDIEEGILVRETGWDNPAGKFRECERRRDTIHKTRYLIINCDDFGLCPSVNEASMKALTEGYATSLSLMAPAPFFREAVTLARKHGIRNIGVHLTLTSEFPAFRYGGLCNPDEIRSLLDRNGYFYKSTEGLASHARGDEVLRECTAQIEAVLQTGLVPTHLDCHMFSLHEKRTGRTDIRSVIRDLCLKYDLPFRSPFDEESRYLAGYGIPLVDQVPTTTYEFTVQEKIRAYPAMLKAMKPGISELILHPGIDSPDLRSLDSKRYYHSIRRMQDYEFVISETLGRLLEEENIVRITWEDLRDVRKGE